MSKKELLTKFKTKTKEITVKAWDDEVVEIRELEVSEANMVRDIMTKGSDGKISDGKMNVSVSNFVAAKIKAVSSGLINPKLSEKEIESMGASAVTGITEIYEAIEGLGEPKK